MHNDEYHLLAADFLGKGLVAQRLLARCGHSTKLFGQITAYETDGGIFAPVDHLGRVTLCLSCVSKMSIRCAWCTRPIVVGDSVSLLAPHEEFVLEDYMVVYQDDPLLLVGCMRPECAGILPEDPLSGKWHAGQNGVGYVGEIEYGVDAFGHNSARPIFGVKKYARAKKRSSRRRG